MLRLDLEGLFTHIIPLLHQGNNYVREWVGIHGTDVATFDFGVDAPRGSGELFDKAAQHKATMRNIWNLYSPWVSTLNELDVRGARARTAARNIVLANSLFEGSYTINERPMIWSEADMLAKSFNESDLSDIELRIQRVLAATREDLFFLLNYYAFDEEVLLAKAAMLATFNFNEEFSDVSLLGRGRCLHPKAFHIKNFNYDAFMRLALMNVTGEPLVHRTDLYERIINQSSLLTGALLILNAVFAVMLIPAIKIITLLLLLFMGLLLTISFTLKGPTLMLKNFIRYVLTPSISFMILNIVFAVVVGLFVGEGLTVNVGARYNTLGVNDPAIMVFLLWLVGSVYILLNVTLVVELLRGFKRMGVSVNASILTTLAGGLTSIVDRATSGLARGTGLAGRAVISHINPMTQFNRTLRAVTKKNKLIEEAIENRQPKTFPTNPIKREAVNVTATSEGKKRIKSQEEILKDIKAKTTDPHTNLTKN